MEAKIKLEGWPGRGAKLLRINKQARQKCLQVAQRLAQETTALAKAESPTGERDSRQTGPRFKNSWTTTVRPTTDGARVTLGNTSPYARYVLEKTKPHRIPRQGSTLLAWQGGKYGPGWHYAMHVQHPGTKGNPVHERVASRMHDAYGKAGTEIAGGVVVDLRTAFS